MAHKHDTGQIDAFKSTYGRYNIGWGVFVTSGDLKNVHQPAKFHTKSRHQNPFSAIRFG